MMRIVTTVLLAAVYLHACAAAVGPQAPSDIATPDAASIVDAAPEAAAEASPCPDGTVEYEGACCWVARPSVCDEPTCAAMGLGPTFCANPQLCCVRP